VRSLARALPACAPLCDTRIQQALRQSQIGIATSACSIRPDRGESAQVPFKRNPTALRLDDEMSNSTTSNSNAVTAATSAIVAPSPAAPAAPSNEPLSDRQLAIEEIKILSEVIGRHEGYAAAITAALIAGLAAVYGALLSVSDKPAASLPTTRLCAGRNAEGCRRSAASTAEA
jgi:hypothetical protein